MTNRIKIGIGIILLLLVISFFLGRCSKEDKTVVKEVIVQIPERKGGFESPKVLVAESSNIKTVIQYRDTTITIPQVNEELMQKYLAQEAEKDILKRDNERLRLYAEAIKINKYTIPFEDDKIKIDIEAETEGKLLSVKPKTYIIKSQSVTTPIELPKPKEKVFSMNMGAFSTYNSELKTFDPGLKASVSFKGGHNISAGYSLDKNIVIGYTKEIFTIRK